jgi:CRP-like cAMP-binding protein/rhodanese-related sulfurtransferase
VELTIDYKYFINALILDAEIRLAMENTVSTDILQRLEPISELAQDQIEELARQTPVESVADGTCIFREGDTDNKTVFLLSGQIVLQNTAGEEKVIAAGSDEARAPIGNSQPRRATATAKGPIEIIRFNSSELDTMITWGHLSTPEPEVIMDEDGVFTVDKGSWLQRMSKSPTFKNLPPANIEQLLDKLEPIRVKAGEVIIRQGDQGDYFYMIDQGSALVNRQTEDEEEEESIELAELSEGTSFGEAALISDNPRNATVSMMSDGILLRLSKEDFLTLLTAPNVQWVEFGQERNRIQGAFVWLDVRSPADFQKGHIEGAVNIPVQQLHRRSLELDKNVSYICYCDTGSRSSAASFILKQHGLTAYVLKGGTQGLPDSALVSSQ